METFEVKGKPVHEKKLIQLESLLNIEIHFSWTSAFILWILPGRIMFLVILLVLFLGVLFIVAIAVLLFQLKKFVWFSVLMIFVVVPLVAIHPLYHEADLYPAHFIAPLFFFAVYSLSLKIMIPHWPD